jgi:hypothetical protein
MAIEIALSDPAIPRGVDAHPQPLAVEEKKK